MKKHISELKNEKLGYYRSVKIWFQGGNSKFYDYQTTWVGEDKVGKRYIEITHYLRGLFYFIPNEETIHFYHMNETKFPPAEYYELFGHEDKEDDE